MIRRTLFALLMTAPLLAQTTIERCINKQCHGIVPPTGACVADYIYQDLSQTPVQGYACSNGGWVQMGSAGSAPVGTQYKIGAYNGAPSGAQFQLGQSNTTTDATGNNLNVPGNLTGVQTNSVINTDLNSGIAATVADCLGLSKPCSFVIPPTSGDGDPNNSIDAGNGNAFIGLDARYGYRFFQNVAAQSLGGNASGFGCFYGVTGTTPTMTYAGSATTTCEVVLGSKTGGGVSANNNWTNFSLHSGNFYFMSSGQSFVNATNYIFGKAGDSIVEESNSTFREAATAFNDEAAKWRAIHFVDGGTSYGSVNVPATHNTSLGTDTVTLYLNGGSGARGFMDAGFVMYTGEAAMDTTTFLSQTQDSTGANLVTTSSPHTVSSWQATVNSPCGYTTVRDAKLAAVCTVNVTVNTTPPTANSVVSVVDGLEGGMYETTNFVSTGLPSGTGTQTVTLMLSAPVNAGAKLMVGGTAGGVGTFANGLSDPTTNPSTMQSWAVGGSPDATHEYIVTNYKQQQQGELSVQIPPVISVENFNTFPQCVTSTSGAVTAPAGAFSVSLNLTLVGGMQWVYSGDSDSTFNGVITNLVVNQDGSASWTAPSGHCTAGFHSNNTTIAITGNQSFVEYCAAEVTAITDAPWQQGPFFLGNGNITAHTDASSCTGATGEAVYQPDRVEQEVQMDTEVVTNTQPGAGNSIHKLMQDGGMAFSGIAVIRHDTVNNVDPVHGDYFGHGGRNLGSPLLGDTAPNAGMYVGQYAPLNGVPWATIGCPLEGCSATQPITPLVRISGMGPSFAEPTLNSSSPEGTHLPR